MNDAEIRKRIMSVNDGIRDAAIAAIQQLLDEEKQFGIRPDFQQELLRRVEAVLDRAPQLLADAVPSDAPNADWWRREANAVGKRAAAKILNEMKDAADAINAKN